MKIALFIDWAIEPAIITVTPHADLVFSVAHNIKELLLAIIGIACSNVVMDLSKVQMIDSLGLGLLVKANQVVNDKGGTLTIINVSEEIEKLFRLMNLHRHLCIRKTTLSTCMPEGSPDASD